MKKALSIILCLSMLMSMFPMSVFAAPGALPIGGETAEEVAIDVTEADDAQQDAEGTDAVLDAEGTVSPLKVLPKSGETVDYRYPVAYYTFGKDVVINAEDVTMENINNSSVGGVYFDEAENTVWVFPKAKAAAYGATITFEKWTSNIEAEDGSKLVFPKVSFKVGSTPADDGENLIPFGNFEYGWTPFYFDTESASTLEYLEEKDGGLNGVGLRTAVGNYSHNYTRVIYKPGTTYKIEYKAKFAGWQNPDCDGTTYTLTPDARYKADYFCPECGTKQSTESDGTASKCANCGASTGSDHSNFDDHPVNHARVSSASITGDWESRSGEFTTRDGEEFIGTNVGMMTFSIYSEPGKKAGTNNGGTSFYIDDVAIYEKVNMTFSAVEGKTALISAAPATLYGYNGDKVTLPTAADYFTTSLENYKVEGWTDGKDVYADGAELTVKGCKVLNPVLVPTGEAVTVTFNVADKYAEYYNGVSSVSVNSGEKINLSEYALEAMTGYDAFWTDAEGKKVLGEYTVNADVTLTATFKFRDSFVFDSQEMVDLFDVAGKTKENATVAFDADNKAIVVTPVQKSDGTYDPILYFNDLEIPTEQYAYLDFTLVKDENTPTDDSAFGRVFYIASENTGFDKGYKADGKFLGYADEAQTKVTYRIDLSASAGWVGLCSRARLDVHDEATPFSVVDAKFVKDEVVSFVELTDIDVPALSTKPDVTATAPADAKYAVESVEWDCKGTYFAGSTSYTVTVNLVIPEGVNGWMFGEETTATINGEEAVVVYDAEMPDNLMVKYSFPATEDAKEIVLTVNNATEITENNGTLTLDTTVAPKNPEDVINPTTVDYAITGGDEGIAKLEGNVLTAIWDGEVEITVTPHYNGAAAIKYTVNISGQEGWTVTYESGTGATVTGMPEKEEAKFEYTVSDAVPSRAGFGFDGWSLVPGGTDAVDELYVEEDVTLYAMWSRGTFMLDFKNQSDYDDHITLACAESIAVDTTGNGYLAFTTIQGSKTGNNAADVQIMVYGDKSAENSNKVVPLADVSSVDVNLATDYSTSYFETGLYYVATDGNGTKYNKLDENYKFKKATSYSGDISEFKTVRLDADSDSWKGYLGMARFDPMQGEAAVGKRIIVDYIRFNGVSAVDYVDVELAAPEVSAEAATLDKVTATSDAYKVDSITWSPALVEGKYFDDNTAYTATITAVANTGYVLSEAPAKGFVNGEEADIKYEDNKLVVTYTFEATKDLDDIEIFIGAKDPDAPVDGDGNLIIDEEYGKLELEAMVVGEVTDPDFTYDVYWSVDNEKLATIDENGVLSANLDGTVYVTAISKYDPQVQNTIPVVLSNQEPEWTVTFAQGFAADSRFTRGIPDPVVVKGKFTLPKVVPTRGGFHFEGWVTELGGDEFVTEAEIHANTTFYAKWAKLLASEEFDSSLGDMESSLAGVKSTTFENGCAKIVYDGANKEGIKLESKEGIFGSSIKVDDIEYVEVRFRLENYTPAPEATGNIAVYVQGTNPDGSYTAWNEGARTDYKYDYNLATGDDFITVRLPRSWHSTSCFKGNLIKYRIHFNNNFACTSQTVVLDYIRFIGKNIDNIDVTDIDVPVTKAQADLTATAVQNEEFAITGVEWSPALLGGMFYDSAKAYTVKVTVEALGNGYMPSTQIVATVNGEKAVYAIDSTNNKKATLTYTFDATEDLGVITTSKVILNEKTNDGTAQVTREIITGDDFDLTQIAAVNCPEGFRFLGWSETEGGTEAVGVINISEDTNYYAIYELIEAFDYSNPYHAVGTDSNVLGALEIKNGWAVVTPTGASDDFKLMTPVTYLKAADFGKIEVIYDGTLKTTVGGKVQANQFGEDATPSLFFTVAGSNTQYQATLVSVDPVVADKRVSYKYTYDMMESAEWKGTIGQIILDPYDGHPAWAVKSITFVRNEDIEEAAVITGVDVPGVWGTPDTDVAVEGNFEVVSVDWGTNLNESGKFKPATAYTVNVVLKPKSGYKIVNAQATVDGKEATATINADGTMTVSYGYAATEALVDFDLTMEGGIIDVADETLKLTPVFTPKVEGGKVTVTDVIWEIVKNGDNGKSAKIAEDGTITAVYNGTITVKATSVYNPAKSVEADVVITNQIDDYTITYVAGADGVTNMPAPEYNKGEHTLSTKVPVRDGFTFVGWSRTPGAIDGITKDVITGDTNFYALWIKGYAWEANSSSDFLAFENARKEGSKFVDGVAYIVPNSASKIMISDNTANVSGKKIPTKEYNQLQVKVSLPQTTEFKLYIQSTDGTNKSAWSEAASMTINNLPANKPGEFQIVTFDLSNHEQFNLYTYVQQIRFDCSISTSQEIAIDWIRFANYETGDVQIDGIDTPVTKAVADTDAESLTDSIKVVGVEWLAEDKDPALLYDYYFDGETEYTAAVTVTGAPGFFVSANPSVYEINGEKADSFKYNDDGTLTIYKKFPATQAIESSEAYELKLIGLDDNFEETVDVRTIFSGESFALGEYVPTSIPTGYRWIGWVAEGSEEFVGDIVVNEAATYYAQYEVLNQFDYSNPTHRLGTVDKNGEDTIVFEDNLAIVEVEKGADSALVTPAMNINAEDYYRVEVYYDTKLEETLGVNTYPNRMDSTSTPELKFTTDTNTAYTKAVLVDSSRVTLEGQVVQKYVYDVSSVANWTGKIGKLYVDPYSGQGTPYYGLPKWGVRLIKLIPTTELDYACEVEGSVAPKAGETKEEWFINNVASTTINEGYEFDSIGAYVKTENGEWQIMSGSENPVIAPLTSYAIYVAINAAEGYKLSADNVAVIDGSECILIDPEQDFGSYLNEGVSVCFYYEDQLWLIKPFAATNALIETKVVISGDTVIDDAGRYVELTGKAVAADGTALPNSKVTWSIDNENVARINETTGRVYPLINGTVTVTATSVYDPSVSATHTIEITNQGELFTVTFNANTQDGTVQGVNTDSVMTRGNFAPEGYFTRDGYFFVGWTTDEDSLTTSKSFNITSDTVLYAVWGKGLAFEFNDDKKLDGLSAMSNVNYNKDAGLFEAVNSGTDPQVNLKASINGLLGKTHPVVQIRIKSTVGDLRGGIYFESVDKAGNYLGHPHKHVGDPNDYVNNRVTGAVTNTGEFVDVSFNMAAKSDWQDGYITAVRYDPFENDTGAPIILDYIRFPETVRTVTFDGNGGEIPFGSEGDTIVSHEVKDVALGEYTYSAVPVRDGYTFLGWSKNPESYDKLYGSKLPVVDDVTFYAMWSIAPKLDNIDDAAINDIVSIVEDEVPADMTVTSDDEGITITSPTEAITPVIKIADEIVVSEANHVLVLYLEYDYEEVHDDTIYLSYNMNGQPQRAPIAEDLGLTSNGLHKLIVDINTHVDGASLMAEPGETTITDVEAHLQHGVVNEYSVQKVLVTTEENADNLDSGNEGATEEPDIAGGNNSTPGGTGIGTFPSVGGGSVGSQTGSTVVTPTPKPTAPQGGTTPSTPAVEEYVTKKTSASGDITFDFDVADDEKLITGYRHMAKVSRSNGIITIANNQRPEGDKNAPAFFCDSKLNLNAATHKYIVIKNNCMFDGKSNHVRVYFRTAADGYAESRAVSAPLSAGVMGATVIDMSSNANWKGTITGLFFSFDNNKGNIEIDSITFTNNKDAVVASTVKFPFVNSFTSNRFVDVKTTDWFYGDVEKSYKIGLMNGKSVEEFVPNGTLTLAEAITVSARLNAIYNGKTIPAATANQKWYDPYVTYAISSGIIKNGQFADYTALATRSEVAVMFANAMPAAWYKQMNMFTSIPDVPSSDPAYKAILTLYNAGVIIGVDDNYNFSPASNIKRSEISAIINRVAIADSRIRVYTEAELAQMTLYFDADDLANVSLSGCVEKTLSFKDGVGYGKTLVAEGKNPDPIVNIGSLISGTGLDASLYKSIEIGVVYGDDIPAGTVANIFFTTADISWSEKARLDAKYDGKKDANGVSVITFNCAANANWKNKITSFRFDPFSKDAQFGVAYIKLVPTVD